MKIIVVLLGLVLVLCEGRIVKYRRPIHSSEPQEESSQEDFNDGSTEEIFEEPRRERERQSRSKPYEKSYDFSENFNKRFDSESDYKAKKPQYTSGRSRGKYSSYGKPPYKGYVKETHSQQNAYNAVVGDRKKDQRSIPKYKPAYQPYTAPVYKPVIHHRPLPPPPPPRPSYPPPPPPPSYPPPPPPPSYPPPPPPSSYPPPPPPSSYSPPSYKPAVPKHSCQQKLLIGCTPTVTRVPCGDHAGSYHSPQPFLGSTGPSYPESPHYAPQSYHSSAAASYNHQALAETVPGYQPYHAPPVVRNSNQPSKPSTPSFAHPVKEDTQDAGKQPFISAFPSTTPTTTTTTAEPQLPTVPADRDQNFRFMDNSGAKAPIVASPKDGEEGPSHKEASGDEPEHTSPAPTVSDDGDDDEDQ